MRSAVALLALAFTSLPLAAAASYSGLLLIPTTDTVGAGHYSLELQRDGPAAKSRPAALLLNTEFGVTPRFEAGVDFDVSEHTSARVLLDAKYVLAPQKTARTAAAVGVYSNNPSLRSSAYAVATRDLGFLRAHAGMLRSNSQWEWFTGLDRQVGGLVLMADYTHGDANAWSAGLDYYLSNSLSIECGAVFPNSGGRTTYTFQVILGGRYRRPASPHSEGGE